MLETDEEERATQPEDTYMIMGFKRGQIVIFNVFNFDYPLARYEICRNSILVVRELAGADKMYIAYDESFDIMLFQLTDRGTKLLHKFNLRRGLFDLLVYETSVYFIYYDGDIDFLQAIEKAKVESNSLLRIVKTSLKD